MIFWVSENLGSRGSTFMGLVCLMSQQRRCSVIAGDTVLGGFLDAFWWRLGPKSGQDYLNFVGKVDHPYILVYHILNIFVFN